MDDSRAIRESTDGWSRDAFKAIVEQYVGLVYSACLRHLKDRRLAEDASQAVILLLSQKSRRLQQRNLGGWLLTTCRYACANLRKREQRRQCREQVAAMSKNAESIPRHNDMLDLLDEALCHLKAADREALVMCYLKEQPLSNVAAKLGVSQDAARKRVERGVEKLRRYFSQRGIIATSTAMGAVLSEQVSGAGLTDAARISLTHGILQVCNAGNAGSAASVAIAKGTQTMMLITKLKTASLFATHLLFVTAAGSACWIVSRALAGTTSPLSANADANQAVPVAANALAATPPLPAIAFSAKLADGVSIEVLGVGENPSRNQPWWNADGSPIANPAFPEFDSRTESPRAKTLLREIVLRVSPPQLDPEKGTHVRWDVGGSIRRHVHISGTGPDPSSGLDGAVYSVSDRVVDFTVRATVAAGKWKMEYSLKSSGSDSFAGGTAPGVPSNVFSCGPATTTASGKTIINCTYSGLDNKETEARLVAIDAAGRVHTAQSRETTSDAGTTQARFSYDVPLASISEWDLQSRHFDEWIEIQHVSAQPGAKTHLKTWTSDGGDPVIITP